VNPEAEIHNSNLLFGAPHQFVASSLNGTQTELPLP
jgi:hypothetical protein